MEEWLIENKDWFVPFATLLCAAFGGWWAGRKRIGIEVLSKNRQEWINDLRKQVSEFTSISTKMPVDIIYKKITTTYNINDKNEIIEKISRLAIIRDYLILLLNPDEKDSQNINTSIQNIMSIINDLNNKDKQELSETILQEFNKEILHKIEELTKNTQKVLKTEWERVKKGV
ncbi:MULTISPECIES: hypothetical protein [unclassified Gilliamella]|uniref:hypothetical protein n=1 Tax=unclassified Gilliamella TaxID=2685620 RepID=UPI002269D277|nr:MULTISPECIES: hypothetical protein [unclassified Gilliamella]MCX8574464.1 hypothetical protein [Gilliamella sp. B3831]MCX8576695.1 hypothetical protein [Gilliamella sp. B3815]MCX8589323.1 hypothetical protein [Gilliamella sp. B3812]MCX8603897.1 hypothetical protein [Gilliamella sp. B3823]MCX8606532.1 hypothetical protein [Gilliamella sp. B3825]